MEGERTKKSLTIVHSKTIHNIHVKKRKHLLPVLLATKKRSIKFYARNKQVLALIGLVFSKL